VVYLRRIVEREAVHAGVELLVDGLRVIHGAGLALCCGGSGGLRGRDLLLTDALLLLLLVVLLLLLELVERQLTRLRLDLRVGLGLRMRVGRGSSGGLCLSRAAHRLLVNR
jgi:hypothetical protein